jgi:hypothetical protein
MFIPFELCGEKVEDFGEYRALGDAWGLGERQRQQQRRYGLNGPSGCGGAGGIGVLRLRSLQSAQAAPLRMTVFGVGWKRTKTTAIRGVLGGD